MNFKIIILAFLIVGLSSCDGSSEGPDFTESEKITSVESEQELVEYLNLSIYKSIDQYEIGLSEVGEVMGYWYVTFSEGTFVWNYSDVTEDGNYSYANQNEFLIQFSNTSLLVEIDFDKNEIILDSITYKRVMQ